MNDIRTDRQTIHLVPPGFLTKLMWHGEWSLNAWQITSKELMSILVRTHKRLKGPPQGIQHIHDSARTDKEIFNQPTGYIQSSTIIQPSAIHPFMCPSVHLTTIFQDCRARSPPEFWLLNRFAFTFRLLYKGICFTHISGIEMTSWISVASSSPTSSSPSYGPFLGRTLLFHWFLRVFGWVGCGGMTGHKKGHPSWLIVSLLWLLFPGSQLFCQMFYLCCHA